MPDWGLRHRSPIFDAFPYWKTGCLAIDGDALSSEIMGCHRNSIGFEPDSNRNRIGLQRIAKDCKGLQRIAIRAVGLVPRHAPTAGPRMWFLVWNDLPGRGSPVHSPVGSRNPAGAYLKTLHCYHSLYFNHGIHSQFRWAKLRLAQ